MNVFHLHCPHFLNVCFTCRKNIQIFYFNVREMRNITFYNTIIISIYWSIRWICPCNWFICKSTCLNCLNKSTYKLRNICGNCRSYQFYDLSRIKLRAVKYSFLNASLTFRYSFNRSNLKLQIGHINQNIRTFFRYS